jgi:hypothetical protein
MVYVDTMVFVGLEKATKVQVEIKIEWLFNTSKYTIMMMFRFYLAQSYALVIQLRPRSGYLVYIPVMSFFFFFL